MKPRTRVFRPAPLHPVAVLVLTAALGLSGCIHYRATPLGGDPAHARPFRKERYGMVIAADVVTEPSLTRSHFYRCLTDEGIVPVVLHLENRGDRTVVFRREDIRIQLENGERFTPLDPEDVIVASQISMWRAYVWLPVVFLTKPRYEEFNFELDRDYREKSLPEFLRVIPGDRPTARAVFFQLNEDAIEELHRGPVIEIPAEVEAIEEGSNHEPGENVHFHLSLG